MMSLNLKHRVIRVIRRLLEIKNKSKYCLNVTFALCLNSALVIRVCNRMDCVRTVV